MTEAASTGQLAGRQTSAVCNTTTLPVSSPLQDDHYATGQQGPTSEQQGVGPAEDNGRRQSRAAQQGDTLMQGAGVLKSSASPSDSAV